MQLKLRNIFLFTVFILFLNCKLVLAQTNPDDYYLNHGFTSGQTVTANSGKFYDDGGFDKYAVNQNWNVRFCSENGNPITLDFTGFRTYNPPPHTDYSIYDYMTINFPSNNYVAYDNDTPQFSFTSPNGCITFGLVSKLLSPRDSGWVAEISANPPPANNDPCAAANLVVGNSCVPEFFSNKGAYNTTTWGSPTCHTFFGGGVWFKTTVPASGQLKIQALPGTLSYAIMEIFSSTSCNSLARITCVDNLNSMPTSILSGRTPGEVIYIRIFGDQAKSGTFGMCVTDPSLPITGFSGPGGVGDSASNELWLRADAGLLNGSDNPAVDAENIKTWYDVSGNINHLVQSTLANRPVLSSTGMNSLPTVVFDGANGKFSRELGSISAPLILYTVASFTGGADYSLMSLGDANNNNTLSISKDAAQRYYSYTLGSSYTGPVLSLGTPYLLQTQHAATAAHHQLKLGGVSQTVNDYASAVSTDGTFKLGTDRTGAGFFNGKVSEAIIYSKALNSAQEIIVNNYLSSKYTIALGSNDKYGYEASHKNDVAGIGRVDATNTHTKAQSAGILAIGGANDLENGEFLLFGHDGGSITTWTSANVPSADPNIERLARTWKVDQTGGDGTVGQVSVSLSSSLLPILSAGYLAYNIFVDADGDFTSGATAYGLIYTGTEYVANNVTLPDGCEIMVGIVKPYVSFNLASSSGFENIANPSISVSLNYAISSLVEVNYAISGGTATGSGVDYFLNPAKVTFNPGQKTAIIQPLIIDDNAVEIPDEYFDITLSAPTAGVQLGTQISHAYTIKNNDIGIVLSASNLSIGTCAVSTTTLTATASGSGPFTYLWNPSLGLISPASAVTVAKPVANTVYKVTITDTNGFSNIDSIAITVVPALSKPSVTVNGVLTFCSGDSVLLSSSLANSYLWSNGATTRNIYAKVSGNYTVIVYDIYGCPSPVSDNTAVNVNALPAKPLLSPTGNQSVCSGDSILITAPLSSSYLWSNAAVSQSIYIKNTGNYSVKVKNATGCQSISSDPVILTVNALPATPTISAGGPTTFCTGGTVTLTSSAGTSYLWSTGATTASISPVISGSYTVQVTNASGCQSAASLATTVTVNTLPATPTISAGGPTTFCTGGTVTLTSSAGTSYLWSTGATTASISPVISGSYTVQVTNASGCQSAASLATTVTVNTLPATPTISAGGPTTFCTGGTVMLTSSAGTSYLWSTGATTASISPVISGSYTVQVTNASGCQSAASLATVVTVNTLPATPTISAGGPTTFCPGGSVNLTSSLGKSYLWSTGETSSSITANDAGSYSVRITDATGCESLESAFLDVTHEAVPSIPAITASGSLMLCAGESVELIASIGNSYLWSTGETTSSIIVNAGGSYTVKVTNSSGCESVLSLPSTVSVNVLPSKPIITTSGPTGFCEGSSVTLTSSMSSGYSWSTGESTQSINVSLSGNYSVIVSNEFNCTSVVSDGTDITVFSLPVPPIVNPGGLTEFCEGGSVSLSGPVANGYLWSNGETNQSINASISGIYTLQILDGNSCLSNASTDLVVTVNQSPEKPIIIPDGSLTFLTGGSVNLSVAASDSYLWTPGGETGQIITVSNSGFYSVSVTDVNNCTSIPSDEVEVIVKTNLDKPIISFTGDAQLCEGESLTLNSEKAFSYLWSNGATTQNITVNESGIYTLIVSNSTGIQSEISDPVTIVENSNPIISIDKTDASCFSGSDGSARVVILSGSGAMVYVWSDGSKLQTADGLLAGNYSVIVTDLNSCKANAVVTVLQPAEIEVTATITEAACPDATDGQISLTSQGGTGTHTYQWTSGSIENTLSNLFIGFYSVDVQDSKNCTLNKTFVVGYIREECFDIPGIITPNNDGYNDTWIIDGLELYAGNTVEIFNRYGKRVFFMKSYDNSWNGIFEGRELPMESYHYIINLNNGSSIIKGNITIVR